MGAIGGVIIAVVIALVWPLRYASHPWRGYEKAAAQGRTAHEFNSSPVARRDVLIALALLGVAAGALSYQRRTGLLFVWMGVWLGLLVSAFVWPSVRGSNLWPFALIAYPFETLPFLVTGSIAAAAKRLMAAPAR